VPSGSRSIYLYLPVVIFVLLAFWVWEKIEVASDVGQDKSEKAEAWAVNVGGVEYVGVDGVHYLADNASLGGVVGRVKSKIAGTQDPILYHTYRVGNLKVSQPIENGVYDLIFKFSEPTEVAIGGRVFSVKAENNTVIQALDIRHARDDRRNSELVRAVKNVKVEDGVLDVSFMPVVGEPLLNAIVVRKKTVDRRTWSLVWYDEFEVAGVPDSHKWSFDIWPARKVNDEDQAYTDRLKNVRVVDGMLVIEAHKEAYAGAQYTSGRLHSQGKGDFLYGRAEIRAKLPEGQGTWPAIWMLSSQPYRYATTCDGVVDWQSAAGCDAWPNSGEIDIMEHVGFDMGIIHGTVHNKAYYWKNFEQRKGSVEVADASDAFHTYAIEWTPDELRFFVDDTHYFSYQNEGDGWQGWPYDHAYHLILNLAVGGMWGRAGGPIDDLIFPQQLQVDYVRIYRLMGPVVGL